MAKPITKTISRASLKKRFALLLVLALIAGSVAYPPPANAVISLINKILGTHLNNIDKAFVLGLDLQGGTHFEYEADVSNLPSTERRSALNGVRDVIERRVNTLGVSEPLVQTAQVGNAWRVTVELAGIRDVSQAIKLIGETPILEFKEQNEETKPRELTSDERKKMEADNVAAKQKADGILSKLQKDPAAFEALAKAESTQSAAQAQGGELGFIKDKPEFRSLYEATRNQKVGLIPHSLELPDAYAVVKVDESKVIDQEIKGNHILIQYAGASGAASGTQMTKAEARQRIETLRKQVTPRNFVALAKQYSQEQEAAQTGGELGWFGKNVMVAEFEGPAFKLKTGEISDVVESPFGFHLIYKSDERPLNDVRLHAIFQKKTRAEDLLPPVGPWKNTQLTGKNLKRAQVEFDPSTGEPQVTLQFDDDGKKLFAEITKRNIEKPVAIFLDGQPISMPTVKSEITGGSAVITGNFSLPASKLLAQRLQAGALPVPIKLIAQQSVGPTLGQASVDKSLRAGLWGFGLVALFMLFWYRLPGFLAILSLLLYVGLSFMLFKFIPVTLTLPGIAGFILSLGIALDANVLVFERLKEELRSGKTLGLALEEAFKRAWPSIRDGNITTLISCTVLYWFSSSVIKGFALTLALGILVSLFTAIVATRTVLRLISGTALSKLAPWLFLQTASEASSTSKPSAL